MPEHCKQSNTVRACVPGLMPQLRSVHSQRVPPNMNLGWELLHGSSLFVQCCLHCLCQDRIMGSLRLFGVFGAMVFSGSSSRHCSILVRQSQRLLVRCGGFLWPSLSFLLSFFFSLLIYEDFFRQVFIKVEIANSVESAYCWKVCAVACHCNRELKADTVS